MGFCFISTRMAPGPRTSPGHGPVDKGSGPRWTRDGAHTGPCGPQSTRNGAHSALGTGPTIGDGPTLGQAWPPWPRNKPIWAKGMPTWARGMPTWALDVPIRRLDSGPRTMAPASGLSLSVHKLFPLTQIEELLYLRFTLGRICYPVPYGPRTTPDGVSLKCEKRCDEKQ